MRQFALLAALFTPPLAAQEAAPSVEATVLVRNVEAGTLLTAADFTKAPLSAGSARGALSAEAAAGKEAVRALPAGSPLKSYDVAEPQLVRKGQAVTLLVQNGALRIEGRGKALSSGAMGSVVRAQLQGGQTLVEGEVVGRGIVRLGE